MFPWICTYKDILHTTHRPRVQKTMSIRLIVEVQELPLLNIKMLWLQYLCSTSLKGTFTLSFILICLLFYIFPSGFLTRKLPANFNESWFIFVSVATTVFIWCVFLPTYFTTYHANHQVGNHGNRSIKTLVIAIQKEGCTHMAVPILLLGWKWPFRIWPCWVSPAYPSFEDGLFCCPSFFWGCSALLPILLLRMFCSPAHPYFEDGLLSCPSFFCYGTA